MWVKDSFYCLPAKGMQPHYSPVVRAERPHRVCQDLLQGEQDLLIEATYKVPMSPVGATFSQRGERGTALPKWTQVTARRKESSFSTLGKVMRWLGETGQGPEG